MSAATVSRGTRLFVATSIAWFVVWQVGVALEAGRRFAVAVGLYGFVFHVVFGKAYALVPSYFDRRLAFPRAPLVHLPLASAGTGALAVDATGVAATSEVGTLVWALGCVILVGTLGWSIRDNLTGRETGTAASKSDRRPIDRFANGFVPVALGYVLGGAALPAAGSLGVDLPVSNGGPPVTHLLAAGGAVLLLFAVGFRLLPRFLVADPRRALVAVVLPAGALGPVLLAVDFLGGRWFLLGAGLQALAVFGFAVAYLEMFWRSDRHRIGLYVVCVAVTAGAGVVLLGIHMAVSGPIITTAETHARLALLGFLGLSVVGVTYQFYPPSVARLPGIDDRSAATVAGLLAVGLGIEVTGLLTTRQSVVAAGRWTAALGAVGYALVLFAAFAANGG